MHKGFLDCLTRKGMPAVFVLVLLLAGACGEKEKEQEQTVGIPTRDEIAEQYKWRLEDIYVTNSEWEEDFSEMEGMIGSMEEYKGRLAESAGRLLEALKLQDEISQTLNKVYQYAYMRRDEDLKNTTYQALAQRVEGLSTEVKSAVSFISPEILAMSDEKLSAFMQQENGLAVYDHYLDSITRSKAHILPAEQENILALSGDMNKSPETIFTILNDGELTWPAIKDEQGKEAEMSPSRYSAFMLSPDRKVRQDAFKAFYVPYEAHRNTLAALLSAEVKTHIFEMKSRGYSSSLESELDQVYIPVEVYDNLLVTINENLGPLHRWAQMKKEILNVDELHSYDTIVPLFSKSSRRYTFEEAKEIIREALRPLGEEYINDLNRAFNEGWIDVYETEGKAGGAYAWGPYGVHPYILLNFGDTLTLDDVSALAHELGHALNSFYFNKTQPIIYGYINTFTTEVASMTNEALLMDYLIKTAGNEDEKLGLLQDDIQLAVGSFYREAMFAEFEKQVHDEAENGAALTADFLSQVMGDLLQKYWGEVFVVDNEALLWARIPHFYYDFYVYNYATSYAASQAISWDILNKGEPAASAYLDFLHSGSSEYPIELLERAGVDMSRPEPIERAADIVNGLIDQVYAILADR